MSFVQDSKTTSTLSSDNRTSPAALTQDSKTTGGNLWSSSLFPWQMDFPWLWQGNGQLLTLDTRHNG
jgi:hypothetical protein